MKSLKNTKFSHHLFFKIDIYIPIRYYSEWIECVEEWCELCNDANPIKQYANLYHNQQSFQNILQNLGIKSKMHVYRIDTRKGYWTIIRIYLLVLITNKINPDKIEEGIQIRIRNSEFDEWKTCTINNFNTL